MMSMSTVEVSELADRFADLIAKVNAGVQVIVTQGSIPRAKLVAMEADEPDMASLVNESMAEDDRNDPLLDSYPP